MTRYIVWVEQDDGAFLGVDGFTHTAEEVARKIAATYNARREDPKAPPARVWAMTMLGPAG